MSAKKRRIKRKIKLIIQMDRQARGCRNEAKAKQFWVNIIALAHGIVGHGASRICPLMPTVEPDARHAHMAA